MDLPSRIRVHCNTTWYTSGETNFTLMLATLYVACTLKLEAIRKVFHTAPGATTCLQ